MHSILRIAHQQYRRLRRRYSHLRSANAVLSDWQSLHRWDDLRAERAAERRNGSSNDLVSLKVKALADRIIYCRPNTTDFAVFEDTFRGLYHLPPSDLKPLKTILDLGSNIGL